jgi:hypothetical protein
VCCLVFQGVQPGCSRSWLRVLVFLLYFPSGILLLVHSCFVACCGSGPGVSSVLSSFAGCATWLLAQLASCSG